jgi:cytochrome c oxidase assembly factor CtaG
MGLDHISDQQLRVPGRAIPSSWLVLAGAVLVAVVIVPPLETLARQHLFAQSIQFCVFAMISPALIALGSPRRAAGPSLEPAAGPESGLGSGPAARRNAVPPFLRAVVVLGAWIGACLVWRLPPVLDALARHPWLVAPELVTLLCTGILLWLELVSSPWSGSWLARPWRAVVAALAMWSIWIIAYLLGFASASVVHAYDASGSLTTVNDQEITAVVLWLVSAFCFAPFVFIPVLSWLRDGADPGEERAVPRASGSVRGWNNWAGGRSGRQARR